jgi:hypothetical protein
VPAVGSCASLPDDAGSASSSLYQSQDVWRRVRVNPSVLTQWNANLRMVWLVTVEVMCSVSLIRKA